MTDTTTTALAALDEAKQQLSTSQYEAIRAGLMIAEDLRTAPGREATASELARSAGGFRRQPHLENVGALPAERPERAAAPAAETTPARPQKSRKATSDYGRARIIH
jgi:hypothetical protein